MLKRSQSDKYAYIFSSCVQWSVSKWGNMHITQHLHMYFRMDWIHLRRYVKKWTQFYILKVTKALLEFRWGHNASSCKTLPFGVILVCNHFNKHGLLSLCT